MNEIVLKPFASRLRRFSVGDSVSEADDFAPLTYGSLKMRHFIGTPPKEASSKKPKDD